MSYISNGGGGSGANTAFFMDPTLYTFFYDDFNGGVKQTANATAFLTGGSNLLWAMTIGGAGTADFVVPADAGTSGAAIITTAGASGNFVQLFNGETINTTSVTTSTYTPLNATTFDVRIRAKISRTTAITFKIGFSDPLGTSEISFTFDTSVGDAIWKGVCELVGTSTRSSIAGSTLDTNYHNFRFHSAVAGTVLFSIDGGAEVSIATNVPTVPMSPRITVLTNANSVVSASIDYFWGWIAITR